MLFIQNLCYFCFVQQKTEQIYVILSYLRKLFGFHFTFIFYLPRNLSIPESLPQTSHTR